MNERLSMQQVKEETRPKDQSSSDKNGDGRGMLADLPPIRGLAYHAVLYLGGVVLILLAVNLRVAPDTLWVVWIALLWGGLLLVWNAWQVFGPAAEIRDNTTVFQRPLRSLLRRHTR